jgi:hypothetical protein
MKHFKSLINEILKPKGKDEEQFMDSHETETIDKLQPGENAVFTPGQVKKDTSRKADRQPGEDVAAYAKSNSQKKVVQPEITPTNNVFVTKEDVTFEEDVSEARKRISRADKHAVLYHYIDPVTRQSKAKWVKKTAGSIKVESIETVEENTLSAKAGRAGKDLGKPGKNFEMIAKTAAKRYDSEEAGKRVAGAILAKMRKEEVEQIDEMDRQAGSILNRYLRKTDPNTNSQKENEKRKSGRNMALSKKWGDKEHGMPEPKVKAVHREETNLSEEMSHEARELTLHADSSDHLRRTSHDPIMANLRRRVSNGTYNHPLAIKLWKHHVDRAAHDYTKTHATGKPWHQMFKTSHRNEAARHFADMAREHLGLNESTVFEAHMTPSEKKKEESLVKKMKKNLPDFQKRYGDRAKAVMYATATKMAMESAKTESNFSDLPVTKEDFSLLVDLYDSLSEENRENMINILSEENGIEDLIDFAKENL